MTIAEIGRRALQGERLDRPAYLSLVRLSQPDPAELFDWAGRITQAHFGRTVRLCSIVPGKLGGCSEDCKWCAQSRIARSESPSARRVGQDEIVGAIRQAAGQGASHIGIVNSGRRPSQADLDAIAQAMGQARSDNLCEIGICASLGELTQVQSQQLVAMGVRRYHHNLETSQRYFPQMVTSHSFADRLETLRIARQAGLQLCCGGLFGLGETWDDRIDLALTLRDEVAPAVTPMNFLHPIPGTPLGDISPLDPLECLRIIAVYRFILPTVDLKICGGRVVNLRDLQSWMFQAGASSCMVGNYLTTAGRSVEQDLQMIRDLGLTVVQEHGD